MIHQGAIIEKVIRRSGIGIAPISRRLNINRRTLYNWFEKPVVSFDIIRKLGEVLQYDFSRDFSESPYKGFVTGNGSYPAPATPTDDIEYWKHKYTGLLEKYTELLENSRQLEEVA